MSQLYFCPFLERYVPADASQCRTSAKRDAEQTMAAHDRLPPEGRNLSRRTQVRIDFGLKKGRSLAQIRKELIRGKMYCAEEPSTGQRHRQGERD